MTTPAKGAKAAAAKAAKPAIDYSSLAGNVSVAEELPKMTRGSTAVNPFAVQMQRSWDDETALTLPAVPNDDETLRKLRSTIRRAAQALGMGVSIREQITAAGVVITFQAKERTERTPKS